MTPDQLTELQSEEDAIIGATERAMTRMGVSLQDLANWLHRVKANPALAGPPPRDINRQAFDLQCNLMALYRVRRWRERFG